MFDESINREVKCACCGKKAPVWRMLQVFWHYYCSGKCANEDGRKFRNSIEDQLPLAVAK
jgi:hypothetical protein